MNHGWLRNLDNRLGHYLLLAGFGVGFFLINLGGPTLWDVDEGRNATAAYEMMESGNWVIPTFNGELRSAKPALLYWLQIFAYRAFGVNEFAARLPSAIAALLTLLVCYELGRSMFTPRTGLITGLIAATTPMLCCAARFANPDALLNLFVCLTLTLFWIGLPSRRTWWFAAVGASAGLAVLAKGPVGLVLPGAVVLLALLWNRQLNILMTWRLLWGLGAFALVALPWYVWVALETRGHFLGAFFMTHNVNRFLAPMENHAAGPWYYPAVLLLGLATWSIVLPLAGWYGLWSAVRRPWTRFAATWSRAVDSDTEPLDPSRTLAYRLLWCWALVWLVFFSLAATKLPNYVLPVVIPLAVVIGRFWDRWCAGEIALHARMFRVGLGWLALTGVVFSAVVLIAGGVIDVIALRQRTIPGLTAWSLLGLGPLAGAGLGWWCLRHGARGAFLVCQVSAVAVLVMPVVAWAVMAFNEVKPTRPLVELTDAADRQRELRIASFGLGHHPSLNFYCQRDVSHLPGEQEIIDVLRYPVPVYVFTSVARWEKVQPRIQSPHRVLGRHRNIYHGNELVVVTNQ